MDIEYKRFAREEFENRWARARELMAHQGLDALLITEANNFTYFSGGHGDFSFSRPTIMMLPLKGDPVALVHDFFGPSQQRETWVEDMRLYLPVNETPVAMMADLVRELGISGGKIGAELGSEQRLGLPYNDFVGLTQSLPGAEFVDAAALFWELRMVKSTAEIEFMRQAGAITSRAFERCFRQVREGMSEAQAAKILQDATVEEGGTAAWVVSNSGHHNYDSGFLLTPSQETLERGNMLWLDSGCRYKGYASDFSRMAAIGEPSKEQRLMYDIVDGITQTVVRAIRPGLRVSELSELCNREFKKEGLGDLWGSGDCSTPHTNRAQRLGHGIGMTTTEAPHVALFDDTVLQVGMTITIEPTIALDYGHFNIEENVVVTDDGFEILSTASRELAVI